MAVKKPKEILEVRVIQADRILVMYILQQPEKLRCKRGARRGLILYGESMFSVISEGAPYLSPYGVGLRGRNPEYDTMPFMCISMTNERRDTQLDTLSRTLKTVCDSKNVELKLHVVNVDTSHEFFPVQTD